MRVQPGAGPLAVLVVGPVLAAHGQQVDLGVEDLGLHQLGQARQEQPAREVTRPAQDEEGPAHRRAASARARFQPLVITPTWLNACG